VKKVKAEGFDLKKVKLEPGEVVSQGQDVCNANYCETEGQTETRQTECMDASNVDYSTERGGDLLVPN